MKNVNFASLVKEAMEIEKSAGNQLGNGVSISEWESTSNKNEEVLTISEDESYENEYFEKDKELTEIQLYDHKKTLEENFEDDSFEKFILFRVLKNGGMVVEDKEVVLPSPQSKCVVNFSVIDEYSELEFMPITYDSFMGIEVVNFIKYNSKFFTCDERVMFITMLVKFKSFGFNPFYWSREVIFKEVGVKKDRARKIIEKFVTLGIVSTEIKKSFVNNRPQQITYFNINAKKVIDLLPQILIDYDKGEYDIDHDIKKYLNPALN